MAITGRPAKYDTLEQMELKIQEYFGSLEDEDNKKPPTVSGLAGFLGFASRQSMNDYEKDGEFSYLIKRVRLEIETFWESRLASNAPTGAIFWLKNHARYADKQEIEHSGHVTIIDDIPKNA